MSYLEFPVLFAPSNSMHPLLRDSYNVLSVENYIAIANYILLQPIAMHDNINILAVEYYNATH